MASGGIVLRFGPLYVETKQAHQPMHRARSSFHFCLKQDNIWQQDIIDPDSWLSGANTLCGNDVQRASHELLKSSQNACTEDDAEVEAAGYFVNEEVRCKSVKWNQE